MLLAFSRTFHYQPFFAIYVTSFIWLELWIHKHKTIQVVKNCLDTSHPVSKITSLLLFLIATLKILSCIRTYFVCMYTHRGGACTCHVHMWTSEDNLKVTVLFIYCIDRMDWIQVLRQFRHHSLPSLTPTPTPTPPPLHPSTPSLPHLQRPSHFLGFFCFTSLSFIVFFFFWPPGFRIHLPHVVVRFDTCSHPFPPSSSLEMSSLAFFLLL